MSSASGHGSEDYYDEEDDAPLLMTNQPTPQQIIDNPFHALYNRRLYFTVAAALAIAIIAIIMQYVMISEKDEKKHTRLFSLIMVGAGSLLSFMILIFALHRFSIALQINQKIPQRSYYLKRTITLTIFALAAVGLWVVAFILLFKESPSKSTTKWQWTTPNILIMAASAILILQAVFVLPKWSSIRNRMNTAMARRGLSVPVRSPPANAMTLGQTESY